MRGQSRGAGLGTPQLWPSLGWSAGHPTPSSSTWASIEGTSGGCAKQAGRGALASRPPTLCSCFCAVLLACSALLMLVRTSSSSLTTTPACAPLARRSHRTRRSSTKKLMAPSSMRGRRIASPAAGSSCFPDDLPAEGWSVAQGCGRSAAGQENRVGKGDRRCGGSERQQSRIREAQRFRGEDGGGCSELTGHNKGEERESGGAVPRGRRDEGGQSACNRREFESGRNGKTQGGKGTRRGSGGGWRERRAGGQRRGREGRGGRRKVRGRPGKSQGHFLDLPGGGAVGAEVRTGITGH